MEERLEPVDSELVRELSRAVALRDFDGAKIVLDIMVRDELICENQVALGRTDAVSIRARDAKPAVLQAA